MIGILTKRGIEVKIDDLINKYKKEGLNKIKKKFVTRYKSPIGTFFIEKKIYTIIDDIIIFPRFAGTLLLSNKILNEIINKISDGHHINMNYIGISNNNQKLIIDYIFKNDFSEDNKKKGFLD